MTSYAVDYALIIFIIILAVTPVALGVSLLCGSKKYQPGDNAPALHRDILSLAARRFCLTHFPVTLVLLFLAVLIQFFLLSSIRSLKDWLNDEVLTRNGQLFEQLPVGAVAAIKHFCSVSSNTLVDFNYASFVVVTQGIALVLLVTYGMRSIVLGRLVESIRLLKLARRVNKHLSDEHERKQQRK